MLRRGQTEVLTMDLTSLSPSLPGPPLHAREEIRPCGSDRVTGLHPLVAAR